MKKILLALLGALLLTACGTGSYTVVSGKADEAMLSFVSPRATAISVTVDNAEYSLKTVKTTAWKKDRNIKATTQNTLIVTPGQHKLVVCIDGKEVLNKTVFISVQEHKIVEL